MCNKMFNMMLFLLRSRANLKNCTLYTIKTRQNTAEYTCVGHTFRWPFNNRAKHQKNPKPASDLFAFVHMDDDGLFTWYSRLNVCFFSLLPPYLELWMKNRSSLNKNMNEIIAFEAVATFRGMVCIERIT